MKKGKTFESPCIKAKICMYNILTYIHTILTILTIYNTLYAGTDVSANRKEFIGEVAFFGPIGRYPPAIC